MLIFAKVDAFAPLWLSQNWPPETSKMLIFAKADAFARFGSVKSAARYIQNADFYEIGCILVSNILKKTFALRRSRGLPMRASDGLPNPAPQLMISGAGPAAARGKP